MNELPIVFGFLVGTGLFATWAAVTVGHERAERLREQRAASAPRRLIPVPAPGAVDRGRGEVSAAPPAVPVTAAAAVPAPVEAAPVEVAPVERRSPASVGAALRRDTSTEPSTAVGPVGLPARYLAATETEVALVVRGGAFCRVPGAEAENIRGDVMVCTPSADGRPRWRRMTEQLRKTG